MRLLVLVLLAISAASSAIAQSLYLAPGERGFALEMSYALSTDHVMGFGGAYSYSPDARLELAFGAVSIHQPSGYRGGWRSAQGYTALGIGAGYLIASQRDHEPFDLRMLALYQYMTDPLSAHALTVSGAVSRTLTRGSVMVAPEVGFTFTPIVLGKAGPNDQVLFTVDVGTRLASRLGRDSHIIIGPKVSFTDDRKIFGATLGLVQQLL